MRHRLRAVDTGFMSSAPRLYVFDAAVDPTALFPALVPFPRVTIGALWRRAMQNLGARLQIAL